MAPGDQPAGPNDKGHRTEQPTQQNNANHVRYVYEDEDLEHVAENMAEQQVRRLPVMNRDKRLIGIVSLGDIATGPRSHLAGKALRGVVQEGGQHTGNFKSGRRSDMADGRNLPKDVPAATGIGSAR